MVSRVYLAYSDVLQGGDGPETHLSMGISDPHVTSGPPEPLFVAPNPRTHGPTVTVPPDWGGNGRDPRYGDLDRVPVRDVAGVSHPEFFTKQPF